MVEPIATGVGALPLAPRNPLSFRQRLKAVRETATGQVTLRDAGGPITRVTLGPRWLSPPIVWVMSPGGAHDVLARRNDSCDRTTVHREMRHLMGDNLADLPNELWLARKRTLQPLFTKQYVRAFGGHMSQAAVMVADGWRDRTEIDLDAESRRLTMRALGRSVLGIDLDERAEAIAEPLNIALSHIADRGLRPVRAPRWLPTPARRRAVAAYATMHGLANDILQLCRTDPTRDAPLVHALIGATDPASGQALSDDDICNDLIAFMAAATTPRRPPWPSLYGRWATTLTCRTGSQVRQRPSVIASWRPTTFLGSRTPFRCCVKRCGCARRFRWPDERPCGTSKSAATGSRWAAWYWSEFMGCSVIRPYGRTR